MSLNPALGRQRQVISEFEASQVYRVSFRTVRAIQRNNVLENKNKTKQKTKKKERKERKRKEKEKRRSVTQSHHNQNGQYCALLLRIVKSN
jgi:hypothetical protein